MEMMKALRNLVGDEFDFRIEISYLEVKVIVSCEMWEEIEFAVVYENDGPIYMSFVELDKWLEENGHSIHELDYGIDINEINVIHEIMIWMKLNSKDLKEMCNLCDKRGEDNLSDDD